MLFFRIILELLDVLHTTEPELQLRLAIVCTIIAYAAGERGQGHWVEESGVDHWMQLPAVRNNDAAWRRQMLRYVEFGIVAMAQHLSSHFDGRDVLLDRKLVVPWRGNRAPDAAVIEKYPEQRVRYSSGAWKES